MQCPVCFENREEIQKLDCGHSFCKPCINTWLEAHNTCPCCRQHTYINGEEVGTNTQYIASGHISSVFVTLDRLASWNQENGFVY